VGIWAEHPILNRKAAVKILSPSSPRTGIWSSASSTRRGRRTRFITPTSSTSSTSAFLPEGVPYMMMELSCRESLGGPNPTGAAPCQRTRR